MTSFYFEWGGSADLQLDEIWPDGDAPSNPTVDDVIQKLKKEGATDSYGMQGLVRDWNLDIQDIEVSGAGGRRGLARVLRDEREAIASAKQDSPEDR